MSSPSKRLARSPQNLTKNHSLSENTISAAPIASPFRNRQPSDKVRLSLAWALEASEVNTEKADTTNQQEANKLFIACQFSVSSGRRLEAGAIKQYPGVIPSRPAKLALEKSIDPRGRGGFLLWNIGPIAKSTKGIDPLIRAG